MFCSLDVEDHLCIFSEKSKHIGVSTNVEKKIGFRHLSADLV
jgi:hypothetical protein